MSINPSDFTRMTELAAYSKGLKTGGYSQKKDNSLSLDEITRASRQGQNILGPLQSKFANYLSQNFSKYDGKVVLSKNASTGRPPQTIYTPLDHKLDFSEINAAYAGFIKRLNGIA